MSSPVISLRRAIIAALSADATLVSLLGGVRVFDEAPPGAPTPRVAFSETQARDWSTSGSRGVEQVFALTVWSGARGTREALNIADRIVALLDEAPLTIEGHSLIDLRFTALAARREQNGRYARVDVRFRATTETV